MDWKNCPSCEEEFKVINDNMSVVEYCPFCGCEIDEDDDEEFEEFEEDEDYDD